MSRQVVLQVGEGREFAVGNDRVIVKVEPTDTSGFALVEYELAPGNGPGQHVHDDCNETYYVLDGELVFRLGRETRLLQAGSLVHVPAGTVHGFRNETEHTVRLLWLFYPGRQFHAMGWDGR